MMGPCCVRVVVKWMVLVMSRQGFGPLLDVGRRKEERAREGGKGGKGAEGMVDKTSDRETPLAQLINGIQRVGTR